MGKSRLTILALHERKSCIFAHFARDYSVAPQVTSAFPLVVLPVLLKWVAVFALIGLTIGPLSFTAAQVAIMVTATTLSVCKPALRKRGT
jgi:hypothetical protein